MVRDYLPYFFGGGGGGGGWRWGWESGVSGAYHLLGLYSVLRGSNIYSVWPKYTGLTQQMGIWRSSLFLEWGPPNTRQSDGTAVSSWHWLQAMEERIDICVEHNLPPETWQSAFSFRLCVCISVLSLKLVYRSNMFLHFTRNL